MASPKAPKKKIAPTTPPPPASARRIKRPAPSGGAITAPHFQLTVLEKNGPKTLEGAGDSFAVAPPTLFAVTLLSPPEKRYLHLLQKTTHSPIADDVGLIVFVALVDLHESTSLRVPPEGAYQRACVKGSVHVLAADKILTREQMIAHVGGHEPGPTQSRPPYT